MAFLIPENLRTRRDVPPGVSRLARALEHALPQEDTVWYEPLFVLDEERPDVVVLMRDLAVLVIQVLEAKARAVEGARDGGLVVREGDAVRTVRDPLSVARSFAEAVDSRLASLTALGDGDRLPVVAFGAFPYLSRDEAEDLRLGEGIDLERCLFRDDLDLGFEDVQELRRKLAKWAGAPLRDSLDDEAEKLHRGVIHPDTVIGSKQLPFPMEVEGSDIVRVLDRRQEAYAKGLGEGHRIIRGVAGSGKTLILVYRARLLAELHPGEKVLVTCYNRALAAALRRRLDFPNVTVKHLDAVMRQAIRAAGGDVPPPNAEQDAVAALALQALETGSRVRRYDHVLVDEAQDFGTDALRFAAASLRPGAESLLIVGDWAQLIYKRTFTWKDVGINAAGRTRILRENYRNTREVLDMAHGFLMRGNASADAEAAVEDDVAIVPPQAALRSGPLPQVLRGESPQHEVVTIVDEVKKRLDAGADPSRIAILYGARFAQGFKWTDHLVEAAKRLGVPLFWATDPDDSTAKDRLGEDRTKVVLSTIHSAKGLEFETVFLCGFLDDWKPEEYEHKRRLIYVGMTRSTRELLLSVSGNHPFIADVERH